MSLFIKNIEGIGPKYAEKLIKAGVSTTEDLLEAGKTPSSREELANKTGITVDRILEWVRDADFIRIKGVSEEYSDLLEEAGVQDVPDLAKQDAESLYAKLQELNEEKELVRKLPTLKEISTWIDQAKKLPKMIEY
ncbi:MAG: DUF4332 domain-containing protein [Candidatus Freyarchaeota archaeon]